eukprot:CAMPEP_0204522300 /NCGR_PEP_ID=MMETSP0661-20131031/6246_1 /ASSEMBLY_ACC=CAM_ASM_000606 /TAXON_ID=109239 /ORGANISM="Alexandrium margalefi, Strain AMGDE01CS-322" /LENGTH=423 /DNA_ID=CAMNT_0051527955 /DNA_START=56 /DNA_END=1327 /DNA_ORIENTATION=+
MSSAGRSLAASTLLAALLGTSLAEQLHGGREGGAADAVDAFDAYVREHSRPYTRDSTEYRERLALFTLRSSQVEAQNAIPGRLWTAGINALSDRTEAELARLRGWRGGAAPSRPGMLQSASSSRAFLGKRGERRSPLPREHMHWTRLPAARSFDQGGCGSCWAMATSKVLQLHAEIYNPNASRTFSPQELVSCVPNPHQCGGQGGCDGSTVELALDWALNKGLAEEGETPYQGADLRCKKQVSKADGLMQLSGNFEDLTGVGVHAALPDAPGTAFGMYGWERLQENGYDALLRALTERGPVGVSAVANSWSSYSGGVFDGCKDSWVIDHAVVLLGYGQDEKTGALFYLIQNSWGSFWGEGGRIRILRRADDEKHCGVDRQPEVGTGCKGGPKEVKVCGGCGILYDNAVPHFRSLGSSSSASVY